MGCDIHMMIEYANVDTQDGQPYWSSMGGQYNPGRDYSMFELLAGVRGDEDKAIVQPRGLPEHKSWQANDYYDGSDDLHSHTWLTLEEYRHVLNRYVLGDKADQIVAEGADRPAAIAAATALAWTGDRYAPGYDAVLAAMEVFAAAGCKTRLLIAFDN